MTECALRGELDDNFIITSNEKYQRAMIKECIEDHQNENELADDDQHRLERDLRRLRSYSPPRYASNAALFGGSRTELNQREAFEKYVQRTAMAVFGSAFLIGPMLIMVLYPSRTTSLVTTTVSVVLFAMLVAALLEDKNDVLNATAAYTAVLVVFVGTSTGTGAS